jgi:hypothetical protein
MVARAIVNKIFRAACVIFMGAGSSARANNTTRPEIIDSLVGASDGRLPLLQSHVTFSLIRGSPE